MIGKVFSFIGGLFTSDKASDTIIDIVRDKAGVNDLNGKDKVNAILDYLDKTIHQSETRRFLAIATMLGIVLFTSTWLLIFALESIYVFISTDTSSHSLAVTTANTAKIAVQPLTQFRNGIIVMLDDVLKIPFTTVFGFYFGSQFINTVRKGK